MKRLVAGIGVAALLFGLAATGVATQEEESGGGARQGGARGAPPRGGGAGGRANVVTTPASFNPAQVRRGQALFTSQCASCHGLDARGGSGRTTVDLLRSPIVLMDISARQLGDFLKQGRPDKGMPPFTLTGDQVLEVSAFLRYEVADFVAGRGGARHNVFSGDSKAGEAYFNGPVGKCSTCHSVTGNLKGIGARTNDDAATLQGAILSGSAGGGGGRGRGGAPATPNVTATVTLQTGQQFTGTPLTINDWLVELRLTDGTIRSWLPNQGWPKVVRNNRLQHHVDLLLQYSDNDIHNLAAYLRDK